MDYNNYYPQPAGHPPPPPSVTNQQQHGSAQVQQQPPPGGQIMHASMTPQNNRQAMPPCPPSHHHQQQQQQLQQMQQPQHLGQHSQQMPSQQHPNYHQIQPPHPHGPPVIHSGSPHPQQQSQQHHNHQPNIAGPPSQQHHMHPHSPHHSGPPMHMQQQQPPQQLSRPPMGPNVMNLPQGGLQQPQIHHNQNFFNGGPPLQSNLHHYPQQNQHHHPHHQPQHHHHHHHQPPMMHHAPPPPMASNHHHHHHVQHHGIGRNSPYFPSILQTEIRIIELNRRLQARPMPLQPPSPLPSNQYDESQWWERFASEFFEDDATLTIRIQDDKPTDYTIGRTLIPRFFRTYFDGGVTDLSINMCNPKEAFIHPPSITLDCDRAFIVTNHIFRHPTLLTSNQGVVVHTEGHLTLEFVNNFDTLSIKSWRFHTKGCREFIDRSLINMGLPNNLVLAEPITRQGLTKSTFNYLKMCMVMEPMQDIMIQNRLTKQDPRSCLKKLLFDRWKYRAEDNRVATNKRRKRKPSAAPAISGAATNKKSKANLNNSLGTNSGLNNNIMMSPSGGPSFALASEAVMVVGEPSMMGGDFGDDNERMITRLENTQYDPTASTPSNAEESDSLTAQTMPDNMIMNNNNNIELSMENHAVPSPLQHQRQQPPQLQQQQPLVPHATLSVSQVDQLIDDPQKQQSQPQAALLREADSDQRAELALDDLPEPTVGAVQNLDGVDPINTMVQPEVQPEQNQQTSPQVQQDRSNHPTPLPQQQELCQTQGSQPQEKPLEAPIQADEQLPVIKTAKDQTEVQSQVVGGEETKKHPLTSEAKLNSIISSETSLLTDVNSVQQLGNHTNSISMNEESNSNSQLPCSTKTTTPALEQQPVDNGVA